ncbi:hypothetical protein P4I85_14195 [Bacillus cereus]|uniref:hypothetical protein n=1 Tax=Bacillus thuringiensis TaxID=1428 RepID=UPI001298E874|nr:hypothetical protein [Bacillus thuringiensis]MDR5047770.1 hypothetical protein [Bacillus thuringiensis]MEB9509550.1 hypothetical protein [Bacillus cereus]MEB9561642.1 hypothetical protein [Bacillus cereus]MRC02962.1 hypothetical protein [Bacillus thuringiensis]
MCNQCEVLKAEISSLEEVNKKLKRNVTHLRNELHSERKAKQKLINKNKKKQHYKNGKRGSRFNG